MNFSFERWTFREYRIATYHRITLWSDPFSLSYGQVRQAWLADPALQLDKWKDPWAECGLADVEGLQEEHQRHVEDLRQRMRQREAELQRLQEARAGRQGALEPARSCWRRRRSCGVRGARCPRPTGCLQAARQSDVEGSAPGEEGLARCLELGKANKAAAAVSPGLGRPRGSMLLRPMAHKHSLKEFDVNLAAPRPWSAFWPIWTRQWRPGAWND